MEKPVWRVSADLSTDLSTDPSADLSTDPSTDLSADLSTDDGTGTNPTASTIFASSKLGLIFSTAANRISESGSTGSGKVRWTGSGSHPAEGFKNSSSIFPDSVFRGSGFSGPGPAPAGSSSKSKSFVGEVVAIGIFLMSEIFWKNRKHSRKRIPIEGVLEGAWKLTFSR